MYNNNNQQKYQYPNIFYKKNQESKALLNQSQSNNNMNINSSAISIYSSLQSKQQLPQQEYKQYTYGNNNNNNNNNAYNHKSRYLNPYYDVNNLSQGNKGYNNNNYNHNQNYTNNNHPQPYYNIPMSYQNNCNIPYVGNQNYHHIKNIQLTQINNRYSHHFGNQTPQFQQQNKNQHQVIHKITPDDTLQGLSLTYGVSINKIKQRNKIHTDTIYYMKTLIIPNPTLQYLPEQLSQQTKISQVMGFLDPRDRSQQIAKFYLGENNWDIDSAVKEYKKDLQWDKHNQIKSIPISQMPNSGYAKWLSGNQMQMMKQKKY